MESCPPLLQTLLKNRGIAGDEEIRRYLHPDYERDLHAPFLLKDMDRAVGRIVSAIDKNEKIIIYGDYDCDGIPGCVLLSETLRKIGSKNVSVYIPHRHNEGYGLNSEAVEQFAREGVTLVITVDLGTADIASIARARELGVDVIVTDHHIQQGDLPPAYAVINPKRADDTYPCKHLSGAGVAFKLAQALVLGNPAVAGGWEKWLLDMVGLAIIADMVPLVGENRALAHFGMRVLRITRRPGLIALFERSRISADDLTEDDIGFTLAPRLNAASRMDTPMRAFELLAVRDRVRGMTLAESLEKINTNRKAVVVEVMREAESIMAAKGKLSSVVVLGSESWNAGILGLVAGRLADKYGRAVFVWGVNYKGSCRTDGVVNVVSLMQSLAAGSFIAFGGHAEAGGFTVAKDKVSKLEDRLVKAYKLADKKENKKDEIIIDCELTLDDVNWENYRHIESCAPYGIGNPRPVFKFNMAKVWAKRRFGKAKDHTELAFMRNDGTPLPAILFFEDVPCEVGDIVSILAHIEQSTFGQSRTLRLRIVKMI